MELPFNSEEFIETWNDWIEYKYLEFKFKYKSPQSMKSSLKKLVRLSGGVESVAIQIIEESMANGWKGFFKLQNQEESKPKTLAQKMREQYGIE